MCRSTTNYNVLFLKMSYLVSMCIMLCSHFVVSFTDPYPHIRFITPMYMRTGQGLGQEGIEQDHGHGVYGAQQAQHRLIS